MLPLVSSRAQPMALLSTPATAVALGKSLGQNQDPSTPLVPQASGRDTGLQIFRPLRKV